jgi:LPPG:FO 2-phospho-L-lactate transferase
MNQMKSLSRLKVAALAGGVGGARLADGLACLLPPKNLTVIVNTGDDFRYLGLLICPDLDTVVYTLAGLGNPATGWGRSGETYQALETLGELGGPTWFRLGDRDIGLHLERTRRYAAGESLSQINAHFCRAFGVEVHVLPVSNDPMPTFVHTDEGTLAFQEYFVRRQCRPVVTGFHFENVEQVRPASGVLKALSEADLVVFCPSNPWVSIDPILSVPGVRAGITDRTVIAVSPIIGGKTVKGPAAKMFAELGLQASALSVARHYQDLLDGFVFDQTDHDQASAIQSLGLAILETDTIMKTPHKRADLAEEVVEFGMQLLEKQQNNRTEA